MHIDILHHDPDFEQYDLSSLRIAVTSGSVCPEQLVRLMKAKYGVEQVTKHHLRFPSLKCDDDQLCVETVGYPLEHSEVKIIDAEGKTVDIGQRGELCVRGYNVMQGYWEESEKTAEAIDRSRWFHTGDLAVLLPSGHLRIVGRLKDMIIRGGENISPREIEDFLHSSHPSIREAQVFGVPDFRMGEEVAAWIKLKGDAHQLSEAEVREFCKGKIAHYKIPRYVRFVNEFPKGAT